MSNNVNTRLMPVAGFPGYFISPEGEVYSARRKKFSKLALKINAQGYYVVNFVYHQKVTVKKVHRLVAATFLAKPATSRLEINHLDGNKLNNKVSNLQWCTPSENLKHAYELGLKKPLRPEQVWNAKLNLQKAHNIVHLYNSGFSGQTLGKIYGVNPSSIYRIVNKESYQNV